MTVKIRGSQKQIYPIEVNVDTVYIRSNISRIEEEEFTGWEYNEVQYDKNKYIELLAFRQIDHDMYLIDQDFRLSLIELGV